MFSFYMLEIQRCTMSVGLCGILNNQEVINMLFPGFWATGDKLRKKCGEK